MDEFPGLLSRDYGFRPQGKAAPMATARGSGRSSSGSVPLPSFTPSASSSAKSNRESPLSDEPADKGIPGLGGNSSPDYGGGLGDLDGFLAGGPSWKSRSVHNSSSLDYDSMFDHFKDPVPPKVASASGPVFDKPIYDEDDMFDGVPGLKTSSAGKFDDVFASLSSSSNHHTHNRDDDLLGDLGGNENISNNSGQKQSGDAEQAVPGFDDLIPGFGGSGSPPNREYSATNHQRSSSQPNKSTTSVSTDPFADLESTSVPSYTSVGSFVDPLDGIGVSSGSTKFNASDGLFEVVNSFKGLNKSTPFFPSDEDIAKTSDQIKQTHPTGAKEFAEKAPANSSSDAKPMKVAGETQREPEQSNFGIPNIKSDFDQFEINSKQHPQEDEDVWLTVSEIPLCTQPTSAPPPSKPPPPFSRRTSAFSHGNRSESANADVPLSNYKQNYTFSESFTDSSKTFGVSSVDELEDFAMGKPQMCAEEQPGVISSEEDNETSSAAATSAAAMKDAMDKAEAKIKQARELRERERESRTAQNREFVHQVKKEKIASDFHNLETGENFENFDAEKEHREREEKEKERRRLEREREKAFVEKTLREARQRAAADARERAAVEAKHKAERAAVEKANAEARERAARAAVNRATAEARERAAAGARDRAAAEARERAAAEARDRAAAEARERVAAEARERIAREAKEREAREREIREREVREKATRESQRAAVQRAAADARQRAERAAVEKANREARERAAAAAATASAREKQSKNENDLDSVFGMGSRATSEPKHRPVTPDFSFDGQVPSKGGSTGARNASSVSSSSGMRKTSSANFLDDLTSVFGAKSSSGEFQEIDGESEERRRARLERHQRTLERQAKALAEKNQRDMQAQRELAEKDRIAERMEVEIKRWAAGKEGNLRALLSTLQYVLWPECGWQAVSLTDLITAASVKKVYRKATLHLHPDKVQQKGANLEQKIIAEKVFDLLKEAWNKFNSEELF